MQRRARVAALAAAPPAGGRGAARPARGRPLPTRIPATATSKLAPQAGHRATGAPEAAPTTEKATTRTCSGGRERGAASTSAAATAAAARNGAPKPAKRGPRRCRPRKSARASSGAEKSRTSTPESKHRVRSSRPKTSTSRSTGRTWSQRPPGCPRTRWSTTCPCLSWSKMRFLSSATRRSSRPPMTRSSSGWARWTMAEAAFSFRGLVRRASASAAGTAGRRRCTWRT
mmetsp:Transcript_4160/g.13179  ORF Transcript_4160/g.13179 Transcript_4160/m.13179 type:complete len:229 (-) Transcript_4160:1900-2586(-)